MKKNILIMMPLLLGVMSSANARTLPPREIDLRQEFTFNTASALWKGSNLSTYGGNGRVNVIGAKLNTSVGLPYEMQVDANLAWSNSRMAKGSEGGRKEGDSVSGISELGLQLTKATYQSGNYAMDLFVGVRFPGFSRKNPDDFIAINDGATKLEFGLSNALDFSDFSLVFDARWIHRTGAPHDQAALNLSAPLYLFEKTQLGPIVSYVNTFGGYDIGSASFMAASNAAGSLLFSEVRESFLAAGVFIAHPLSESVGVDAYVSQKFFGANTDKGLTLGLGFSYSL